MPRKPTLPPLTPSDKNTITESILWLRLDDLILWVDNYNEGDIGMIATSIRRFGFASAPRVWKDNEVRGGNHTVMALRLIRMEGPQAGDLNYPPANVLVEGDVWRIPCVDISHLSEQDAKAFAIADNRAAQRASQNNELLIQYLEGLYSSDPAAFYATGYDEDDVDYLKFITEQARLDGGAGAAAGAGGDKPTAEQARTTLAERFIVPPFSVLDARQGYWQERKRAWMALGINPGAGRGVVQNVGSPGDTRHEATLKWKEKQDGKMPNGKRKGAAFGQDLMRGEGDYKLAGRHNAHLPDKERKAMGSMATFSGGVQESGVNGLAAVSYFDPVLCEICNYWFNVPGGHTFDPFAGSAVGGIVAAYSGYQYTGIELRLALVEANRAQAAAIGVEPTWIAGDSSKIAELVDGPFDLILSDPPFYDLEIYGENPIDGSTFETYDTFLAWYGQVFAQAVDKLADNRFAVLKVSEIRDKQGVYRNFVGDTIEMMVGLGMHYYNEAILVTPIGSLPVRVGQQFTNWRKLGKGHQNILVFYKGDPRKIKDHFAHEIEIGTLDDGPDAERENGDENDDTLL